MLASGDDHARRLGSIDQDSRAPPTCLCHGRPACLAGGSGKVLGLVAAPGYLLVMRAWTAPAAIGLVTAAMMSSAPAATQIRGRTAAFVAAAVPAAGAASFAAAMGIPVTTAAAAAWPATAMTTAWTAAAMTAAAAWTALGSGHADGTDEEDGGAGNKDQLAHQEISSSFGPNVGRYGVVPIGAMCRETDREVHRFQSSRARPGT
jgi:hypothetical protein